MTWACKGKSKLMVILKIKSAIHRIGTYFGLLLTAELSRGCVAGTPKSKERGRGGEREEIFQLEHIINNQQI